MNYLSVEKLSRSIGEKLLFDQITFGIEKGDKTALIARNGAGKSTLLNIIAGLESADSGEVVFRNNITVSYLPQVDSFSDNFSIIDTIFDTQTPVIQAIKEYEIALSLSQHANSSNLQRRLHQAIEEMDRLDAWNFEFRAKEILSRFGIDDIFKNMGELSGGQRKKTALAKTLIAKTDLLILDEPTNHLDIEMIEWLEEYLSSSNTTLLMVTHDRYFLDQVCNNIIELDNHTLYSYKGKYDYFLEKKAERLANAVAEHAKIRQLYHAELAWIHTSPQARTTKAKARIQSFEQLKERTTQEREAKAEGFQVKTERIGNKILEINNLDFSYDDNVLLNDFSYIFKKGEKCGIVGKNGSGKSTLLKLIMGEIKADGGKITPGLTIQFGYFAQDGLPFAGNKRVIELVKEQAEVIRMENGNYVGASQFLNYFGFKYDQQYTYYEDLSGGERRKLHLLITLLKNPNFLILDEPTNDFDIDTLNLLEDFLYHYKGCLLVVSHDRWFMDKLVDHIFIFEGSGKIKDHYGNYTEYRLAARKALHIAKQQHKSKMAAIQSTPSAKPVSNRRTFKENQELEHLEIEIGQLEEEKRALITRFDSGNGSAEELLLWSSRYRIVDEELEIKTVRWIELSEKEG
ncbi:MAG: ABC-F family ATP-binding cassette domain-containing protein [Bacteroidales bacterium]|jgi:ATP-binding cassette subfamily F protein uup|nr:ABC-F family ATP-binding cassette domain-containing protein [Bacteroidales bacterium]